MYRQYQYQYQFLFWLSISNNKRTIIANKYLNCTKWSIWELNQFWQYQMVIGWHILNTGFWLVDILSSFVHLNEVVPFSNKRHVSSTPTYLETSWIFNNFRLIYFILSAISFLSIKFTPPPNLNFVLAYSKKLLIFI